MRKILVTYFSASNKGMTEKLAKNLAKAIEGDLFEIKPEQAYTEADINWINPFARCNKEKLGKKDVPIKGKVENMSDYDLILIGFPVWYGAAPNIINTFVKEYDFSGKKIALFATSGGGGMGKSGEKLKPNISESAIIAGSKLFKADALTEELADWVKGL